ncbi:MAG: HEAT repeat domain-containing protein [Methanotrichaceae archaeon]|nr:HEAT repeat domain-containing protein [Methanotrichaceae archaeon]
MIQALKDENVWVRSIAAESLGKLNDTRAFDPLTQSLNDEEEDSQVRWSAAYALGKLGDHKAIDPLIQASKDEDKSVQEASNEALGKLGYSLKSS